MSAITQGRMPNEQTMKHIALPMAYGSGMTAYKNAMACVDTSTGTVKPGAAGNANLIRVGTFDDAFDNSGGSTNVNVLVNLDREVVVRWFDNGTAGAKITKPFVTATILDNNTVGLGGSGDAGFVWLLDPVKGVGVASSKT